MLAASNSAERARGGGREGGRADELERGARAKVACVGGSPDGWSNKLTTPRLKLPRSQVKG